MGFSPTHHGPDSRTLLLPMLLSVSAIKSAATGGIGVNYGTRGTTLPAPADVARFLARETLVDRARLFDADPAVLQAFAGTGLAVDVTVPNAVVPRLVSLPFARRWGARERGGAPRLRQQHLARPRRRRGHQPTGRCSSRSSQPCRTCTPRWPPSPCTAASRSPPPTPSLGVLTTTEHLSAGRFRNGYDTAIGKPLLRFLRATSAPFMVNAYLFYGLTNDTLDLALFRMNGDIVDEGSGLVYTNMLDAVHSAIRRLGFGDVEAPRHNAAPSAAAAGPAISRWDTLSGHRIRPRLGGAASRASSLSVHGLSGHAPARPTRRRSAAAPPPDLGAAAGGGGEEQAW